MVKPFLTDGAPMLRNHLNIVVIQFMFYNSIRLYASAMRLFIDFREHEFLGEVNSSSSEDPHKN